MYTSRPSADMENPASPEGELNGGPRLIGSPKKKSPFATSIVIPNAKTNTSDIIFLISLSFQKVFIFTPHTMRSFSNSRLFYKTTNLLIENHFPNPPFTQALQCIFSQLQGWLKDYQDATYKPLNKYLDEFSLNLAQTVKYLKNSIEELQEIINKLAVTKLRLVK